MRLLYTPIRNYTHTVEAVIAYAGLAERVTPVTIRPLAPDTPIGEFNPLGTVPTLITDDGEALYGGPVIYEYLDSLHAHPPLHPRAGAARWTALRQGWMADGMFDATVRLIIEAMEPPESHRAGYIARCWAKIARALDQMERDAATYGTLTIGQVRAVGAISFLALKLPSLASSFDGLDPGFSWRNGRPRLAAWYETTAGAAMFRFNLVTVA